MSKTRILIVDDDPKVLTVVARLVEAHGFPAEVYNNPKELLETVNENDVGCVVTDLEMPGMSGIGLQNELNRLGSCLSVIVITGFADVPRAIEIMSHGAETLLEKPFKSTQLISSIERGVEKSLEAYTKRQRHLRAEELIGRLAEDELEIMKLAAAGLPNKAISMQLDVSPRTIDRRRQSALEKLEVASVADFAVLFARSQEGPG